MSQSEVARTSLKTWYNKWGQLEVVHSINSQIEHEDCHLQGWIEILHFPFGSHWMLRLGTCINVKQIFELKFSLNWHECCCMIVDGGSFHQGLGWIHYTKKCGDPRCFVTPLTGKTSVFTGDISTNKRRGVYSYSLMQTKHLSSKIIQFCTICKLRNMDW